MNEPIKVLDTKGFCVFCLRSVGIEEVDPSNDAPVGPKSKKKGRSLADKVFSRPPQQEETMKLFSQLIGRYLGAVVGLTKDERSNCGVTDHLKENFMDFGAACRDCFPMVTEFCQIYSEIKNLALKLEWRVAGIRDVVKCSSKSGLRAKDFLKQLSGNDGLGSQKKKAEAKLKELEAFRKDFMEKCNLKLNRTQPRIRLKRRIFENESLLRELASSSSSIKKPRVTRSTSSKIASEGGPSHPEIESVMLENESDSMPVIDTVAVKEEPLNMEVVADDDTYQPEPIEPEPPSPMQLAYPDRINSETRTNVEDSSQTDLQSTDDQNGFLDLDHFDTHDDNMEIEYHYSTNDKKVLPHSPSKRSAVVSSPGSTSTVNTLKTTNESERTTSAALPLDKPESKNTTAEPSLPSIDLNGSIQTTTVLSDNSPDKTKNPSSSLPQSPVNGLENGSDNPIDDATSPPVPPRSTRSQSKGTSKAKNDTLASELNSDKVPVSSAPAPGSEKGSCFCSICNKTFTTATQLASHVFMHANPSAWPFHCKYCNQRFYRASDFKRHRASAVHAKSKTNYKINKKKAMIASAAANKNLAGKSKVLPGKSILKPTPDPTPSTAGPENVKFVRVIYVSKKGDSDTSEQSTSDNGNVINIRITNANEDGNEGENAVAKDNVTVNGTDSHDSEKQPEIVTLDD